MTLYKLVLVLVFSRECNGVLFWGRAISDNCLELHANIVQNNFMTNEMYDVHSL